MVITYMEFQPWRKSIDYRYISRQEHFKTGMLVSVRTGYSRFGHMSRRCCGNLKVIAFPKFRDAFDPHSFIVSSDSVNVGIFTDIGIACENVIRYFKQCHAAFLEANYDEAMLENGGYPRALKNRISSDKGHLSNKQAMQLFITHRPSFMTHLFLSHLSKHNNTPKIVKEMFFPVAGNTQIIIASRDKESKLYHIRETHMPHVGTNDSSLQTQLSLF